MRTFTSYIFIHWYIHHFYYWNKVCAVYVTNIKIFQTQVTLRLIAIPGGVSKCSKKRANFFKKGKKTCSKRWGGWDLGRGKYHPLLWYNDGCWRQWWWIPQPRPRMRVSVRVGNNETSAGGFSRQLLSSVTNTLRCPHKYTAPVIHNEM